MSRFERNVIKTTIAQSSLSTWSFILATCICIVQVSHMMVLMQTVVRERKTWNIFQKS